MNAPARPKPLPWDELKSRLDENQPFNMMRNTPYYRDAVYEQFSQHEYARRYAAIRAKMRAGGLPIDACIRDVSSKGLMIQAKVSPPRGTYVEIITHSQTIVGRVVWGKDMRFGILTRDKIHVDMMVAERRAPPSGQCADPQPTAVLRPASVARKPGFRRSHARALEFGALILFALAMVATFASATYQTLSRPFESVAESLAPGR